MTEQELSEIFQIRYGNLSGVGWAPRMRWWFNYFTPDEYYEAVLDKLVAPGSRWLDVGCGRNVFPGNSNLAQILAKRCERLVGLDPDETLEENTFVHQRIKATLEEFQSDCAYDVVTLRMVAEHIADPSRAVSSLSRLTKPGSKVVIYTVNRNSPVSIISWWTPFALHDPIKRIFWGTEEKDTFPVWYRMNTRKELGVVFGQWGFKESSFAYLDDCRTLAGFRATLLLELCSWRVLHAIGLRYPENCLLGVYERC